MVCLIYISLLYWLVISSLFMGVRADTLMQYVVNMGCVLDLSMHNMSYRSCTLVLSVLWLVGIISTACRTFKSNRFWAATKINRGSSLRALTKDINCKHNLCWYRYRCLEFMLLPSCALLWLRLIDNFLGNLVLGEVNLSFYPWTLLSRFVVVKMSW